MTKLTVFTIAFLLSGCSYNEITRTITPSESYETGMAYYMGRDGKTRNYKKAFQFLRSAADRDHPGAQYYVGQSYALERGVKQDKNLAAQWYQESANQDNADAEADLAFCYKLGNGVARDAKAAFYWFKRSAQQGNERGQFGLAMCYQEGIGVRQSISSAREWHKKAAGQGYSPSVTQLKKIGRASSSQPNRSFGGRGVPNSFQYKVKNGEIDIESVKLIGPDGRDISDPNSIIRKQAFKLRR